METDFYFLLHEHFNSLPRHSFPFDKNKISNNGIYILFEKGETVNQFERIVRIGSHDGNNQLVKRLGDHFLSDKQRNSIFRKHVGRCLLTKNNDSYINSWNLPFKKKVDKAKNELLVNLEYEKRYEEEITTYIRTNISFCIIPDMVTKQQRNRWEEGLIALLAQSAHKISSKTWLGNIHPDRTISQSRLWNIEHVNGQPLTKEEFDDIVGQTQHGS